MPTMRAMVRTAAEDLRVTVDRDPSVGSCWEALLHPALPALWTHRLASGLHGHGHRLAAKLLANLARTVTGVEIHPGATVGRRVFIDHGAGVVIGETAVIGDDVTIFHQVTLGALGWWSDNDRPDSERRHPVVGDRVVIGCNATVLGPVTIGDGARIGAQALVTGDVPPGCRVHAPLGLRSDRARPAEGALELVPASATAQSA